MGICKKKWLKHLGKVRNKASLCKESRIIEYRSILQYQDETQVKAIRSKYEKVVRAYHQLPEKCQQVFKNLFTKEKKILDKELAKNLEMDYGYFRKKKCECRKLIIQMVKDSIELEQKLNQEV